ncbi:MAG: hypothetical protein F6K29_34990 [Okeania sp. SIO2G5]|nr:hypothetical protein [Okeania sp. SIO2G5]
MDEWEEDGDRIVKPLNHKATNKTLPWKELLWQCSIDAIVIENTRGVRLATTGVLAQRTKP